MAHHRWLVITVSVAVVMGGIFVGAMAAATNDTHYCVLDDVMADPLGPVLIEPASQKSLAVNGRGRYGVQSVSIAWGRISRPCPPRGSMEGPMEGPTDIPFGVLNR